MIGEILNAVINECTTLLNDSTVEGGAIGGTVLLETDFLKDDQRAYSMPLVLLDLEDAPESGQWCGGSTRMEWMFGLNSYAYEPDAFNADITDFSTNLLNVIDTIRRHFSLRNWLTTEMTDIEHNYGFRFTLSGLQKAIALQRDGLIIGYRVGFDSIAIDDTTDSVQWSESVLEGLHQAGVEVNNEIYDNLETNDQMTTTYPQTINVGVTPTGATLSVPKNTFVPALALQTAMGNPSMRIGTTEGGDEIMADTEPGIFQLVTPEFLTEADTVFYFTQTGDGLVNVRVDMIRNYFVPLVAE